MNNFNVIYKILKYLEKAMDYDEIDISQISAGMLGISQNRWNKIMSMLNDDGYMTGICVKHSITGETSISLSNPQITLKGLEYLSENSLMKKAANIAKGIIDITT